MKKIITILALLALSLVSRAADASFESSDGLWTDSTVEAQGRDFRQVLWAFEAYKLKRKEPLLRLHRVTPDPEKRVKAADVKWKVPFSRPSGRATSMRFSFQKQEIEEITRRADAAYDDWKSR